MSSIFKRDAVASILVKPYALIDVTREAFFERTDVGVFEGIFETEARSGQLGSVPLSNEGGAQEVGRERTDRIEKEAYENAFKQGEQAGIESGERMFRSAVQSLVEAARQLKQMEKDFYGRVEREILELVLATTRKVVQKEVDSQRDMILGVLKEAIGKAIDRERIRVRINPSDYDLVHAHKADIVEAVDGIKHLVIEKDEAVSRGGAIVESDCGTIDARIERRFEEVERALNRQKIEPSAGKRRGEIDPRDQGHAN